MNFANREILIFLFLIPALLYLYSLKIEKSSLNIPLFPNIIKNNTKVLKKIIFYLQKHLVTVSIIFFIIALARPQKGFIYDKSSVKGIDIILAIDISSSMKAEDFKPNRLEAAKEVALKFVKHRENDKIGIVAFSKDALTICPLTLDHQVVSNFIKNLKIGLIEDGTAIGMAIAEGSLRLSKSKSKSRILILLTDGVNNSGKIDPITAARASRVTGIKIYTIGVGSMGRVPYPINDPIFGKKYITVDVSLDESGLKKIASITDGKYFRAIDSKSLEKIYSEIDKLEKSNIETKIFKGKKDIYIYFIIIGLFFLLIHIILNERVII